MTQGPDQNEPGQPAPGPDPATEPRGTEPASTPREAPPDTGTQLGLLPGKVLKDAFRHPTKHFVMLPRGTILRSEFIEAIRLMGCERQALLCLGEVVPPDTPPQPDVLHDGPIAAAKIDREIRIFRQTRDVLALFLALLLIFALALRHPLLVVLAILAAAGWGALHLLTVARTMKIEAISEAMNTARVRRAEGERQLQEALIRFGLLKQPTE